MPLTFFRILIAAACFWPALFANADGPKCLAPVSAAACSNADKGGWQIAPDHLKSRAIFISCNPETDYSGGNLPTCRNVAEKIIDLQSGAVLNVIVQSALAANDQSLIEVLSSLEKRAANKSVAFNILKTESLPGDFSRDAAVLLIDGAKTKAAAMPDIMGGTKAIKEALQQCGDIKVTNAYSRTLTAPWTHWYNELYSRDSERFNSPDRSLYAEGGNFIGLPDGSIVAGESANRKLPTYVVNYFAPRKVIKVRLPEDVGVGHADEFFNVVPAKNPRCEFAILAASPRALREWALHAGAQVPASNQNLNGTTIIVTWSEVLKGDRFPWWQIQAQIDAAKLKIWEEIRPSTKCAMNEIFVDVPMGWDIQGRPYFSNPVNGMHLNGNYLMSETFAKIASPEGDPVETAVPEIREAIASVLLAGTGLRKVVPIDTNYTDGLIFGTGGNLHCLTLQAPAICPMDEPRH